MSDKPATNGTRIFSGELHRLRRGRGYNFADRAPAREGPAPRPARVAQMLALAHRLQDAIALGEHKDRADAARRFGLTRARITQVMDLLLLAPDIQEQVLELERIDGVEPLSERAIRPIAKTLSWAEQRDNWKRIQLVMRGKTGSDAPPKPADTNQSSPNPTKPD
ncbi:MAG: hypothetical protein GY822_03570 [Deltaproteobacteria bacterium]|nr:hypothetical protein [Deltaproteobacteria bacterium]